MRATVTKKYPEALPHLQIEEVFTDVFLVHGTMRPSRLISFGRNMIIVRHGDQLTLINTVRLDEAGLAELDDLGRVTDVVKLGYYHDRDDPFYVERYRARFWALPGHRHNLGLRADVEMTEDTELSIPGARLFAFRTTRHPEAIVHLDRDGGALLLCDALQNWPEPGFGCNRLGRVLMRPMRFFRAANVGPVWSKVMRPDPDEFARLQELPYRHMLGAHGQPLMDTAHEDFGATFARRFGTRGRSGAT